MGYRAIIGVNGLLKGRIPISRLSFSIIVFVLFITLITAFASVWISSGIIRNETNESNMVFLGKLNKLMDSKLMELDRMLIWFYRQNLEGKNLQEIISDPYQRSLLYDEIQNLSTTNEFIDSIYLVYSGGKQVYYHSLIHYTCETVDMESFYDRDICMSFISGGKFYEIKPSRSIHPVYSIDSNLYSASRVVSLMKRIPIGFSNTKDLLVANISESYLLSLIGDNFIPKKSMILISDAQNNELLFYTQGENDEEKLEDIRRQIGTREDSDPQQPSFTIVAGNTRYYVTEFRTNATSRIYTLVTPESELLKPIYRINIHFVLLANVILVLGVLFSTIADKWFFRPVREILQMLKNGGTVARKQRAGRKPKENEFTQIAGFIDTMITQKNDQEKLLQSYFAFYKERVLQGLLYGEDELLGIRGEIKIFPQTEGQVFLVILASLAERSGEKNGNAGNPELAELLHAFGECLQNDGYVEKISINRGRIAYLLCLKPETDAAGMEDALKQAFDREVRTSAEINAGIGRLCLSLREVHQSFADAERALKYAANSGKGGIAGITELPEESREAGPYAGQKSSGMEAGSRKGIDANNRELVDRVVKYLNTNYMQEIGLNTIAEYIYLSPSYFGKLFKEVTGYTFTDYLIKVRMGAAVQLLKNGNLKVAEICEKVGYVNLQSFNKIFKGIYHCTPGEYRRKNAADFLEENSS